MRSSTLAASAAMAAGIASASPMATITIEASHGGAGSGLTNNTIYVPIGPVYTNADALAEVSTLYLTGASDTGSIDTVTCIPYGGTGGYGTSGRPFNSTTASYLSTNTVVVGSIVCVDTPSALVTIEASHGGAGSDLTNGTIAVPIGTPYANAGAFAEVSTLYLTGANDADVHAITCTAHKETDGTGVAGLPFDATTPSRLSTNTVVIGSIVCVENNNVVVTTHSTGHRTNGTDWSPSSSSPDSTTITATATGTGVGSLSTGIPSGGVGSGSGANVTSTLLVQPTPTAASTGSTGTSTPNTSGATGVSVPYAMSALLFGAAGLFFSL